MGESFPPAFSWTIEDLEIGVTVTFETCRWGTERPLDLIIHLIDETSLDIDQVVARQAAHRSSSSSCFRSSGVLRLKNGSATPPAHFSRS